jgi:hypothetical protein
MKLMFIILKVKNASEIVPQNRRGGGDVGVASEKSGHFTLMRRNSFVMPLIAAIMESHNMTCA